MGLGSRREIESWIREERIKINGQTATLGDKVNPTDSVRVDGRLQRSPFQTPSKTLVLLYHKPEGELCTRYDSQGRHTIFDDLPALSTGRWISVGRLDINTSGLLLLTNNGELAHQLMHPSFGIVREYSVRVFGDVTTPILQQLIKGVTLDGHRCRFETIEKEGGTNKNTWYKVTLTEGRNRAVRRLWESQGIIVSRLMRTRFAGLPLPRALKPGQSLTLNKDDIETLHNAIAS